MSDHTITVQQLQHLLGMPASDTRFDDTRSFTRVAAFEEATPETIVFAQDQAALDAALRTAAGLVLAPLHAHADDGRLLRVSQPKYAFAVAGQWLERYATPVVHPAAIVDPDATVGLGTAIGAGTVIHHGAVIGSHCWLGSNVTVHGCVTLGDHVVVKAGAVLGGMGFGYVRGADGKYLRFPQQGTLTVEDDVDIGANTTIDRGALGETRIGAGTKIDNQVHIGHNCRIGRNVMIAAQVGISGSCVMEDGVIVAGQVGLGDHVSIGPDVILGGAAGVFPHKRLEGPGKMFMGVPAEPLKDYLKSIARVRRLR